MTTKKKKKEKNEVKNNCVTITSRGRQKTLLNQPYVTT